MSEKSKKNWSIALRLISYLVTAVASVIGVELFV